MALKIAVLVKEVPDLEVKVGVSDGGTELEVEDRNVLNFFDELAVEEAVRIRESGLAAEVYCVSAGDGRGNEAVRRGVAMVAELRGIPCVAGVVELELEEGSARVVREQPDGKETLRVPLPAVLTAEKGLNTPRVPQVMGVMKAMKVQVPTVELEELGVEAAPELRPRAYHLPPERPPVKMLEGEPAEAAAELVRRLREEAGVL